MIGRLVIGQFIGNYRIVRRLGSGCMGDVYEARNDRLGKTAAIKVLKAEWMRNDNVARRFLNEARAANVVHHPGLVDIYEFGRLADGTLFLIMEYLAGETLRHRLWRRGGRLDLDGLFIVQQLATTMALLHRKGVVHRDLKPDNVMLVADHELGGLERVKVLDFGLAKLLAEIGETRLTYPGTVMGTPTYMAPEQCLGLETNDRADVYSLGIMLYEMLCGTPPFRGDEFTVMRMHQNAEPLSLRERDPDIGEDLAALVHRMIDKQPMPRPSMSEIVVALDRLLGQPTERVSLVQAVQNGDEAGERVDSMSLDIVVEDVPRMVATLVSPLDDRQAPREPTPVSGQVLAPTRERQRKPRLVSAALVGAGLCGLVLFFVGDWVPPVQSEPHAPLGQRVLEDAAPSGAQMLVARPFFVEGGPDPLVNEQDAGSPAADSGTSRGTKDEGVQQQAPAPKAPTPRRTARDEKKARETRAKGFVFNGEEKLHEGDLDGAAVQFGKALALNPSSSLVLMKMGEISMRQRRGDDAVEYLLRAHQLAPGSDMTKELLVKALFSAGRFGETIEWCTKFLEQDPDFDAVRQFLKMAQVVDGKMPRGAAGVHEASPSVPARPAPTSSGSTATSRVPVSSLGPPTAPRTSWYSFESAARSGLPVSPCLPPEAHYPTAN